MATRLTPSISAPLQTRRLSLFVLISAVLHLAILAALRAPASTRLAETPPLQVRLATPAPRDEGADIPSVVEPKAVAARRLLKPRNEDAKPVDTVPSHETSASVGLAAPGFSVGSVLESARQMAREEARKQSGVHGEGVRNEDRAALPQLARALRREAPGEKRFASGMIKVVTASGSVYCLQPKPTFARDGPVEPLSIPTNCP